MWKLERERERNEKCELSCLWRAKLVTSKCKLGEVAKEAKIDESCIQRSRKRVGEREADRKTDVRQLAARKERMQLHLVSSSSLPSGHTECKMNEDFTTRLFALQRQSSRGSITNLEARRMAAVPLTFSPFLQALVWLSHDHWIRPPGGQS